VRAALVVIMLGIPVSLSAQDGQIRTVVLEYDAAQNTLAVGPPPDSLQPGGTLKIRIGGQAPPADYRTRWSFTLNGIPMILEPDGAVYASPVPDAASYAVDFRDSAGQARMTPDPLPLDRVQGAAEVTVRDVRPTMSGSQMPSMDVLYNRRADYVNLVFLENGLPDKRGLPRDVDDNDVIHIYLALSPGASSDNYTIQVKGTIKDQEVNVLGSGSLGDIRKLAGTLHGTESRGVEGARFVYFGSYGPYSSPEVTITISRSGNQESKLERSHALRINRNYIASVRFGVGRSDAARREFDLKRNQDSQETVIQDVADGGGELRPFVTVVFYGWKFWKRNDPAWNGRDIEEKPLPAERLNPMVGIGLDDIGDEYLVGLSYEVARGLDVFGGMDVIKSQRLAGGFAEGDAFTGDKATLPVRDDWEHGFIFGASLDARVAASVLGGLLGGS
jgi:hypothetical protein